MRRRWIVTMGHRFSLSPLLALVALTALLGGCRPSSADSAPLQGTQWVLLTREGEPPLAGEAPSAEFSAGQTSGSTGCHHQFGEYAASSGDMAVGDLARTERYCMKPAGVMDQEDTFLNALMSAVGYRVAGGRLELLDANDKVVLAFRPAAAVPESRKASRVILGQSASLRSYPEDKH